MSGFNETLDNLKTILQNDADLTNFCKAKWGKSPLVMRMFKYRTEIALNELPVILITRPTVVVEQENNIAYERTNTVRLYIGFHQPNREIAQEEVIGVEEAVEKALVQDLSLGGTVDMISPGSSVNDEGYYHPVYFIVKDFTILKEEVWRI